jgi:hypothetical protein
MNVECPKCKTEQFDVEYPLGDDDYTAKVDLFPPGQRFVAKGERITKAQAHALGLIDEDGEEVAEDDETDEEEE